jgi:hypothetical protein
VLNSSKPNKGSSKTHTAAANTTTAAIVVKDTDTSVACAQREWQFSVLIEKFVNLL